MLRGSNPLLLIIKRNIKNAKTLKELVKYEKLLASLIQEERNKINTVKYKQV